MPDPALPTQELLIRWHGGDGSACEALVERHLPWVSAHVSRRLGPALRAKGQTHDYVQEAMLELLRYGPAFLVEREASFRRLLARIVENVLRDQSDWYHARRRDMARERPLPSDTFLDLDRPRVEVKGPQQEAERQEWECLVRLALELLPPSPRRLLLRRQWDGASFAEIGAELGISEDAARMRFHRALLRVTDVLDRLRDAHLDALLTELEADAHE